MSTYGQRGQTPREAVKFNRNRPRANGHASGHAHTSPSFPFDQAEAKRFLSLLDGEAGAFVFAAGDDDKERRKRLIAEARGAGKKAYLFQHRRDSVDRIGTWIEEQQEHGWGVFVSVQAMKAAKCQIGELAYIRAVFAEMDISEPLKPWPIEPSIIVESSPGKCHVYWLALADEPLTAEDFSIIMMCIVETYGGDPDAKDLARRLRLPGTWNLKPGREPHFVRIIHESGARYPATELLATFTLPPRPKVAAEPRPAFNGHSPGLERFVGRNQDGPLWAIPADRYGDWLRVGMALHEATGGASDGLALWDQWSATAPDAWSSGGCEEKWRSFSAGRGISGGTIFGMATDHGWRSPIKESGRPAERSKQQGHEGHDAESRPALANLEFDDQIKIDTSVNALVKGILHPSDLAALYGPSGAGKTFTAIDLAYHIARGVPWHGRRVRQAPVLYVGLEGVRGLRHRMEAYKRHMGSAGRMLARLQSHTLLNRSDVGAEGEAAIIEGARALAQKAGKPVGLIIIDTLARAIAGDDENSAQDMAAFVGRMSAIERATGAAVMVVHHPGKDDTKGMRGSTALFAACDAVFKITSTGNVREVTIEKAKDAVNGPLFSYTLKQVPLGTDEDGDEITSCIVEVVAAANRPPARPPPDSQAGRALTELEEIVVSGACRPAKGHSRAPDGAMVVSKSRWREACRQKQLSDGGDEGERKGFQRSFGTLLKSGLIGDHGDDVWPISGTSAGHRQNSRPGHTGTWAGHRTESGE